MRFGFLLLALFCTELPAQTRVEIRVLDNVTRQALDEVHLRIAPANDQFQPGVQATTDRDGGAEVSLPPGRYVMQGDRWDLGNSYYNRVVDTIVNTLVIKPDQESEHVEFLFEAEASVSGIVRDELGDPVPQAYVTLLKGGWEDGRLRFDTVLSATTDDRGAYVVGHVQPGLYVVCAQPSSFGIRELPVLGVLDFQTAQRPRAYQRTCVPGGTLRDRMPVGAGEQVRRDIVLGSAPPITIEGKLVGPSAGGGSVTLRHADPADSWQPLPASTNFTTGEFRLQGVPPGDYVLQAELSRQTPDGRNEQLLGRTAVTAGGGDVSGVVVEMQKKPTVMLHYEAGSESLAANVTNIGLKAPGRFFFVPVGQATPVEPGTVWLTHNTKADTCITGVRMNGHDVFRTLFTLKPEENYEFSIRLSQHCGKAKVRAVADGQPVPQAKLTVLLSGTPAAPGYSFTLYAHENGEEDFLWIAPGKYWMWAWPSDTSGTYVGPPDLASVAASATLVEFSEQGSERVDLPVLRPEAAR